MFFIYEILNNVKSKNELILMNAEQTFSPI